MFGGYTKQFLVCLFVFCTVGFSQVCLWPFVCESQDYLGMIWVKKEMSFFFSAKQFCVFHKYSRGKKSICESNSLRGLHQMKMLFFLNPPHLTQEVFFFFCYYSFSRSLSLSFSFFTFDLNSDIRICPRMSVTNCSPTLWQCFFSSRAFYDLLFSPSFCSFFLFFPFQGLAHLTLNDQGMGSFLFIWVLSSFFFFF